MIIESAEKIAERSHFGENPKPISVKAAEELRTKRICQIMARDACSKWEYKPSKP